MWWGDVEAAGDNQFDWSYYTTYANVVSQSGLKWVKPEKEFSLAFRVGS